MDYAAVLPTLETLKGMVDRYTPIMYGDSEERKQLFQGICETYGQVSDVYTALLGTKSIEVPDSRSTVVSRFPNYFEAGFLSGRTFHTHQGKTELMTVIGKVRAKLQSQSTDVSASTGSRENNRVFLVHGHNQATLQTCARFVEKLGLPLTILSEEPSQGRTIFQKFLDHSDVGFAIVLLTADDRGGRVDQAYEDQSLRARQNVIFELGYFLGRLDKHRVCALYENGVEIPSDYHGVAFVPLDARQAWRFEVAKEMKAAGLPVDLNNI